MIDALHLLQHRNSAVKLTEPAPDNAALDAMFRAALRSPDHAWLRPWRFICIAGERRVDFGEALEQCLLKRDPGADEAARNKARAAPLRAPLLVVVVVDIVEHPKVPPIEQRLSGGCAAQSLMLAAEAQGFAGIWRTGAAAFDREVMNVLGLAASEEIIGFVYLGTRSGNAKKVRALDPEDFVRDW